MRRFLPHCHATAAYYLLAVALPLTAILFTVELALPAFIFEHLMVLLVVALAVIGGRGPAIAVAITGSVGDNILLRAPIGRPAINGLRDAVDFGLFLAVAATVGWLVNRLRSAREQALAAAERERLAREERDRLVATITHDLATPLGAIQGTIQFARKNTALSALDLPRLLVRIETAAARAISLIGTLSDVRSLGEDALFIDIRRADLRSIVEPTVRMLDRVSDRHSIALEMPTKPLLLDCDVTRVGRVIENLLTNAIKYSPDGGLIQVSVTDECGFAVVRVADSGIGISTTQRDRLFEPGYRSKDAISVAPGLGLGLYIAAAIVRRHGGTLEAANRDSGGSVFTMRLPLISQACKPHARSAEHLCEGPYQSTWR